MNQSNHAYQKVVVSDVHVVPSAETQQFELFFWAQGGLVITSSTFGLNYELL